MKMDPSAPVPSNNNKINKEALDSVNKRQLRELLKGVIAYVDVRLDKQDFSDCVATEMTKLGATVVEGFLPEVTHLVFFGGYRRSYKTALRRKIHIVVPHWISDSKAKMCKQDEGKYIPDMPPPREEVPFFRKRRYKPIVDQIIAGTYVPMDQRDANYVEPPLTKSALRKLNSRQARTSKTPGGTPRAGGTVKRSRKKIVPEPEQDQKFDSSGDEDEVSGYIKSLFNGVYTKDDSLSKVISESLRAIKEKHNDDKYNLWVDTPITMTKCGDDEDAYVPLFERCRAKLLAENKLRPPSNYNSASVHTDTPASEAQNCPDTPSSSESNDQLVMSKFNPAQNGVNASKEILHQKKRRGSPEARSGKKAKLDKTLESDEPLKRGRKSSRYVSRQSSVFTINQDKDGSSRNDHPDVLSLTISTPDQVLPKSPKNKVELGYELRPTEPMNKRGSKGTSRASQMIANKNLDDVNNIDTNDWKTNNNFSHSLQTSMPSQILNRTSLSSDTTTPSHKISKSKLKTPSQPSRRSTRLSMRVQISLDRFLTPKDASNSKFFKSDCSSNTGPLDPSKIDNKNTISATFHDQSQEDNTLHLPANGILATTNLHE